MKPADATRLAVLSVIWGASFLLIKIALDDMSPFQIVWSRLAIGAAVLYGLLVYRRLDLPSGKNAWTALVLMAIVSNIIPFALISYGEEHISSSLAAILNSTTPLFTAGIAAFVLPGERMNVRRALGILLGFVGVAVIVGVDSGGEILGELAVIAASASYGLGFVYARSRLSGQHGSPLSLSAGQMLVATVLMIPIGTIDVAVAPPTLTLSASLAVLGLGVGGTGIAYVLYYRLISDVGATTASFVTYLIPIFGVALGTIFKDEKLGPNTFAGAALVIAGIALAERARAMSVPEPVETAGDMET